MIHQSSKHDFLLHLPFLIDEYFLIIHQITPYLILGGGTIHDRAAGAAAAQNSILRLDLVNNKEVFIKKKWQL